MPKRRKKETKKRKGYDTSQSIRDAARLRYNGATLRETAETTGYSITTISKWQKQSLEWQDEIKKLKAAASEHRLDHQIEQWKIIDNAQERLTDFAVQNLESITALQKEIYKQTQNIQLPDNGIKSVEDIVSVTKALFDLTRLLDSSWESFQSAIKLEEFLKVNAPKTVIEFKEYTEQEIEAIAKRVED